MENNKLSESQREWGLASSLSTLDSHFHERDPGSGGWSRVFWPPTLEAVAGGYDRDATLRARIEVMLESDAIQRLYAAVLISKVDWSKSQSALQSLKNDDTAVSIQAHLGFRRVPTTVGVLARDFLGEQQTRGANFAQEEALDGWSTAISMEKRGLKRELDVLSLPRWQAVLEAHENSDKMRELRVEIERLKRDDGVAEKFYAAFLLRTLDETAWRHLLESLLGEETPVTVGEGDIKMDLPAREVAAELLNPRTEFHTAPPSNWIARAQKWLERNYFRRFNP